MIKKIEKISIGDFIQQGDVILTYRGDIEYPNDPNMTTICHTGNNHQHSFSSPVAVVGDSFYLIGKTILEHQEHDHIELVGGEWHKTIVKEYDHWLEESREVID